MKVTKRVFLHTKSYAEFIEELDDFPIHVIIDAEASGLLTESTQLIQEGQWSPSSDSEYYYRKDTPKFSHEHLHVHIAHKKHINSKSQQVSWNDDGTRHDRMSFNKGFKGLEKAKNIARDVLNLGPNVTLESVNNNIGKKLLAGVTNLPSNARVFIFRVEDKGGRIIL